MRWSRLLTRRLPPFPTLSSTTSRHHSQFSFSVMASASRKVLVPVANETEPMEVVVTIDVLCRAGAEVTVASVEIQIGVDACHGVKVVADALVSDCVDTVGMPGASTLKDNSMLENMVKKKASESRLYAASCAAPAVALGSWGLVNGLKVRCQCSKSVVTEDNKRTVKEWKQIYGLNLIELLLL